MPGFMTGAEMTSSMRWSRWACSVERETAREACYSNTADTGAFLSKESPAYLGGILEMPTHGSMASGETSRRR